MANPEIYHGGAERTVETEKAARERSEELRNKTEKSGEHETKSERLAHEARIEAEKQAKSTEDYNPTEVKQDTATFVHAKNLNKAYDQTMQTVRHEMSAPSRAFSKVIHNKVVEKTSDIAGVTIARPNALLSGAICAFLLVLALYLHARYFGYALSGFESIGAFIIGWSLGVLFDIVRMAVRRKY